MSRGIGICQRDILDELAYGDAPALSVVRLADEIDAGERQVRRAARSLERRGLVTVTKTYGHGHAALRVSLSGPQKSLYQRHMW